MTPSRTLWERLLADRDGVPALRWCTDNSRFRAMFANGVPWFSYVICDAMDEP
jgi:hypothetical protein